MAATEGRGKRDRGSVLFGLGAARAGWHPVGTMAVSERAYRIGRAARQALPRARAGARLVGPRPDPAWVCGIRKALLGLSHLEPGRRRYDRAGFERPVQPDRVSARRCPSPPDPRSAVAASLAGRENAQVP